MSFDAGLEAAIAIAEADSAARIAAAVAGAEIAAAATTASANIQATADHDVASINAGAQKAIAVTRAAAEVQVATIGEGADLGVADKQLTGSEYSADRQFAGIQAHETAETGRLNIALAFAEDKWQQIWPALQQYLQNPSSGQGSAITWNGLVGALGAAPTITVGPYYTPSQMQAELNELYVRADMKSTTMLHDAQIDLAGRGFGGASPILDMLRFSYEAENIETSTEGARTLRFQLAKENADSVFETQKGRQEQYATQEKSFIDLDKVATDFTVGILDAVSRIVASVARA